MGEDRWRELWKARLSDHKNHAALWLRHQRRDAFWKHGSVNEDYGAIECAVLAVGGFLDGYTPTIFRLVENLKGPVKGICGPWGHKEPQAGVPGPAIGYLQECVRWFDHWLKGIDNGADRDSAMRVYLMDHAKPHPHMAERTGRWLGFPQWPAKQLVDRRFYLNGTGSLSSNADSLSSALAICSPLTTGVTGQEWCPYGQGRIAAEGARDQRADDAGSLYFDTDPMDGDLVFAGVARIWLRIAADRPQAQVCVRLTDVAPDGTSAFLTLALLNLAHRESHEFPTPIIPGAFETVDLVFKPVAQVIPRGHRLRIAISPSYWPMAWPSPEVVTLTVDPALLSRPADARHRGRSGSGQVRGGPARCAWSGHYPRPGTASCARSRQTFRRNAQCSMSCRTMDVSSWRTPGPRLPPGDVKSTGSARAIRPA